MSTQSWSSRVRHDSDATFQEWASDLYAKLVAVGLTQTSDTGQLTAPVVASRPALNTLAGYWIFRFNDTQQATAPIFLKVEVGTGSTNTFPRIMVTVGTGSNGSGTLTGTALTTARAIGGGGGQVTDTARQSYLCYTDGFLGLCWKVGSANTESMLFVMRTVDSTASPTATGAMVVWKDLTSTQALRFAAPAAAYTLQTGAGPGYLGFNPQAVTTSAVGSDIQAFLGYTITPRAAPLLGVCGVIDSEVSAGSTFSTTLVGSTAHTYIGLTTTLAFALNLKYAMLWE